MINSNVVFEYFNNLQTNIVETLQIVDGKNFINDSWQRKEGGGEESREHGDVRNEKRPLLITRSFLWRRPARACYSSGLHESQKSQGEA